MVADDWERVKKMATASIESQQSGVPERSEFLSAMRFRLVAIIVVLLLAVMGLGYVAVGASVRSSSDSTLRTAALYAMKGKPDQAREELKWLLWFEPRHPAAVHLTAISYLKQNNLPAAMEQLRVIGEDSALHENAQSLLASALLADQQLDQAEVVLSNHLRRYPKSVVARRQLFGIFLTEMRSRDAIRVQEEYLRESASDRLSQSDRLLMLRDLATSEFHPPAPQACLKTLQLALERHPEQPQVELALGRCYLRVGNTEEAIPLLRKGLARDNHAPEPRFLSCELWIANDDPDRAELVLLNGSESPSGPAAHDTDVLEKDDRFWELRCQIAESRNDLDRALNDIDQAAMIRPFSKDHVARRARLLQRLQRTAEAQQAYTRSHELARAELDLWKLSLDLGTRNPTPEECEQMALHYTSLGKNLPADCWRQLGRQVATETSPGAGR